MAAATIIHGDARHLPLADCTVDAIVCDPPYSLPGGFMGKDWDRHDSPAAFQAWCQQWAREALRVLKPGGHMIAFGGTRTFHRLTCAIEDAGFEIRDSIGHAHTVPVMGWTYGSGFPKSLDVSRAIDRAAGAQREVVGTKLGLPGYSLAASKGGNLYGGAFGGTGDPTAECAITAPATDEARRWQGFGTALKPAHEPIVWAQKPFSPVPFDWRLAANVHHALAGLLWLSLSPAKRAETTSPSNPHAPHAATCVSALVAAAIAPSPDASAKTATYSSPAAASTCSNIAASWSTILAALSTMTKTSTTATRSNTTTALKTLNSLLAPLTSQTTMPRCECLTDGSTSSAPSAGNSSSGEWANWIATLSASVPESAIEGIALAACNVLANIAAELSSGPAAASTARSDAQRPSTTPPAGSAASDANGAASSSSPNGPADGSVRSDVRGSEVSYAPAWEPIVVARKPLDGKTVAQNVLAYGCGALNIDATRVPAPGGITGGGSPRGGRSALYMNADRNVLEARDRSEEHPSGRWPSNVVFSHVALTDVDGQVIGDACADGCVDGCPVLELDRQSGVRPGMGSNRVLRRGATTGVGVGFKADVGPQSGPAGYADSGGASRFFATFRYQAKAPSRERPKVDGVAHPTCKPLTLLKFLCRLVGGQPGSLILDPFAGSGTTLEAALLEGFNAVGVEQAAEYLPLIQHRIDRATAELAAQQPEPEAEPTLFDVA